MKEILRKFKMEDCKPILTPMVTGCELRIDDSSKDVDQRLYRSMINSLLYVTTSQLDVMKEVGKVERFQVAPKESHIKYSPALEYLRQKLGILPSSHYIFLFPEYKGGVEVDYKSARWLCVRGSVSVYRSIGWLCFRGSYPLPLMSKGEIML